MLVALGCSASVSTSEPCSERLDVSIVIPCLDEAATVGAVVGAARRAIRRLALRGEVLVVDNGSTDGSPRIAAEAGARVTVAAARGYGAALRHGVLSARGRLVVIGDADGTYDFGEVDRFVDAHRAGADLIMGTRLPPGIMLPGANPWLHRHVGTPVLTFILNRLFGTRIRDVNCGMRAIARDKFLELDLRSDGMEFASEMLVKASVLDLSIAEVPVTLHPDRRGRVPHLRRWRDGWRHLEFMLLHAPDQLLFTPGLLMVALGALLAVPVTAGPIRLAGVMFDYHYLLLGSTLILIGLQGVLGTILVRDVVQGRVLRPHRFASVIARRLDLRKGLATAGLLFAAGFLLDAALLATWVRRGFGALPELRESFVGMVLMAVAAEIGVFSFLHAAVQRHAHRA